MVDTTVSTGIEMMILASRGQSQDAAKWSKMPRIASFHPSQTTKNELDLNANSDKVEKPWISCD